MRIQEHNPKSSIGDRIRLAMEKTEIKSFEELATLARVGHASIYRWIEKNEIPRGSSRYMLANALNVSEQWLRDGTGPMEAPEPLEANLTPEQQEELVEKTGDEFIRWDLMVLSAREVEDFLASLDPKAKAKISPEKAYNLVYNYLRHTDGAVDRASTRAMVLTGAKREGQ